MTFQVDLEQASEYLKKILQEQVSEKENIWIEQQEEKLRNDYQARSLYFIFSSASRHISKTPLQLTTDQVEEAGRIRKGFQPGNWNLLQCVRIYLLLMIPIKDKDTYFGTLTKLHEAADVDEQVSLYNALPLLPYPELLVKRAAEGIRTNITDVFDAIALHNPYPHDFLDQNAWNQMVLKAVFMQRPLHKIYGADDRANPELAGMLIDFAHERWAANRKVIPELWRFVGPFLKEKNLADIQQVIKGEQLETKAGLLACSSSNTSEARQLLESFPDIKEEIETGKLNWTGIGEKSEENLLK